MDANERSGTSNFIRPEKKNELFRKVILSLVSVVVLVVGELIKNEEETKKY